MDGVNAAFHCGWQVQSSGLPVGQDKFTLA
jgi:hypothetical protein